MTASISQPSSLAVPDPEANDSQAVAEGLLAARAELARGQPREALRLVRQAAEACDELGNDLRALALARFAADLANEVASLPPPAPVAPAASQRAAAPASEQPASPPPPPAPRAAPAASQQLDRQGADPELAALLSSGRAVRVLVKRSVRDDALYVVRQPVDGKPVYDAREAVIVLLDQDPTFFGTANNAN